MVYVYVFKQKSDKYYIGKTNDPKLTLDSYNDDPVNNPILIHKLIPDQTENDEERIIQEYKDKYGDDNVINDCNNKEEIRGEELIPRIEEPGPSENIRGSLFDYAEKKLENSAYKYAFSSDLSEKVMAFAIQSWQIALFFGIAQICSEEYAEIDPERDPMQMSVLLFICFQVTIMYIISEAITCFSTCTGIRECCGNIEELSENGEHVVRVENINRETRGLKVMVRDFCGSDRQCSIKISLSLFFMSIIIRVVAGIYATYVLLMYECSTPVDYFMNCIAVLFVNDMDETLGSIAQRHKKLGGPSMVIAGLFGYILMASTVVVNYAVGNIKSWDWCTHPEDENNQDILALLSNVCTGGEEKRAGYVCRTNPISELFNGDSKRICTSRAPLQAGRLHDIGSESGSSGVDIPMSYGLTDGQLNIWLWIFLTSYTVLIMTFIRVVFKRRNKLKEITQKIRMSNGNKGPE